MILMALDHTRDFLGVTNVNPADPAQTTIPLFFLRGGSHTRKYCHMLRLPISNERNAAEAAPHHEVRNANKNTGSGANHISGCASVKRRVASVTHANQSPSRR
jgi:hypothetical protein